MNINDMIDAGISIEGEIEIRKWDSDIDDALVQHPFAVKALETVSLHLWTWISVHSLTLKNNCSLL